MSHIRFSRFLILTAVAAALMIPTSAAARVGIGFYGGYYPYAFAPYGYGYYPYGYAPYAYGPYGYGYGRPVGEVQLKSPDSNAQIFINGAFAGRAHDLKKFYLAPGTYNVEQRIGADVQKQRIYVLASRTIKLAFDKPGAAPSPANNNVAPRPDPGPAPQSAPPPSADNAPRSDAAPVPQQPAPAPAPTPEEQR